MTIYVPNIGEKEMLKDILASQAINLGLYKNQVTGDGSLNIDLLEELPTGGGRGYAQKALTNDLLEGVPTANKWAVSLNASGKAEAQYHNAALEWVFNSVDVGDSHTVYGIFGYTWVLPFDAGLAAGPIKVGDTVTGAGGATGVVTAVVVYSGTWAGNNAAGYLCIKSKTGTFVDNESLSVGATPMATVNTGITGDAHKKLVFIEPFSAGKLIEINGQKITYVPKITLSSAA
jgi:hypothetical protein